MVLYLVLSHTNPEQVGRLCRRLLFFRDAAVRIHHDQAGPTFDTGLIRGLPNVGFVEPSISPRWGRFSQVQAVLNAIASFIEQRLPYDWLVLLSGQDYPTQRVDAFHHSLATTKADGFLDYVNAAQRFVDENATRYYYRYYQLPTGLEPFAARLWRINASQNYVRVRGSRLGAFLGLADREPFSEHVRCFRGSFWWTLHRRCAEYLHHYVRDHPDFVQHYRDKLHPDESFVQSVLLNAGRFQLHNDDLRYLRWDDPLSGSPALLREGDFAAITAAGKAHARKFDSRVDPAILDRIDCDIHGIEPPRG